MPKIKSNKKLKIAIFCWRDPFNPRAGGAEYVTLQHAQAWISAGHEVTWFSSETEDGKKNFIMDKIHYKRSGNEKLFFVQAYFTYKSECKDKFSVIIDQAHGLPNLLPVNHAVTKKILLIHEVAGEIWDYMFPFPINVFGKLIERFLLWSLYRNAICWVDSYSTKIDLVSLGLSKNKIFVIPCAIDRKHSSRLQKNKELTLIFLARLVPMKGIEFAIKVIKHLLERKKDARLLIAGSGETAYLEKLKADIVAQNLNENITFLGKVSEKEKADLFRKSHFLLHTSVKEGFGLTVLEAYAQHTPAAIFNIGSLNELVVDGYTGIASEFHDEKKLAQKILTAYSQKNVYKRMSEAAYQYEKQYRWPIFTRMSRAIVEEV